MSRFIVTIDGPAGSGKSTIAKLLAKREGFIHINSGIIYRSIAYRLGTNISKSDLIKLDIGIKPINKSVRVFIDNMDMTDILMDEEIGKKASKVAMLPFVREYVNKLIRKIAKNGKYVIDGRDCGSVIFPDANVKIFLVGSVEERAKRRALQTNEPINVVIEEIKKRDEQDSNREIAPLIKPKGAIEIDTTALDIETVYKKVLNAIRRVYDNRNS